MAVTGAHKIATLILSEAHGRGVEMTNLKLQKLLYYAQAWHLAITGLPLFDERIEAWVHGPVVPPVFGTYKQYRWNAIPCPDWVDIEQGLAEWPIEHHITEILNAYAHLSGVQLERLTHSESPWRSARKGLAPDEPSTNVITHESMREFFKPQISRT